MNKKFDGKHALVTGAASGMGKALALAFADNGADLTIMDINSDRLQKTADEIASKGRECLPIVVDLSSSKDLLRSVAEVDSKGKSIDILANCAGISTSRLFIEVEEEEWDRVMNINLKSVFLLSREVAKMMIRDKINHGKIVSISSQASKIGELANGSYSVSKAGVNMFTQVLALELAGYGISVNAVCPGYVNTEMMQDVFQKRGPIEGMTPEEYKQSLMAMVPMGRIAEPEEIASLMMFLSSEEADYITGMSITMAGGRILI